MDVKICVHGSSGDCTKGFDVTYAGFSDLKGFFVQAAIRYLQKLKDRGITHRLLVAEGFVPKPIVRYTSWSPRPLPIACEEESASSSDSDSSDEWYSYELHSKKEEIDTVARFTTEIDDALHMLRYWTRDKDGGAEGFMSRTPDMMDIERLPMRMDPLLYAETALEPSLRTIAIPSFLPAELRLTQVVGAYYMAKYDREQTMQYEQAREVASFLKRVMPYFREVLAGESEGMWVGDVGKELQRLFASCEVGMTVVASAWKCQGLGKLSNNVDTLANVYYY